MNSTIINVPVVTLINNGVEPRNELRFDMPFEADASKRLTKFEVDSSIEASVGGVGIYAPSIPTIIICMETCMTSINAEGDQRYEFKVLSTGTSAYETAMSEQESDKIREILEGSGFDEISEISGFGVLTNRGLVKQAEALVADDASDKVREQAEQLVSAMNQFTKPLPIEAVGVGAMWKTELSSSQNGMLLKQEATYELIEVSTKRAKCKVSAVMLNAASEQVASYNGETEIDLFHAALNTGWVEGAYYMNDGAARIVVRNKMTITRMELI